MAKKSDIDYKALYESKMIKYQYALNELAKARDEIEKLKEILEKEHIYIITKP